MSEQDKELDTRGYVNHLLDSEAVLGKKEEPGNAAELIKSIPSITMLGIIASINLELYLNDTGDKGQKTQNILIKGLLPLDSPFVQKILKAYSQTINNGQWPTIFYRYSNLLFYELILDNYNSDPFRDITQLEMEKIIRAYLIINSLVNERIQIDDDEFEKALENNTVETVVLPKFIYQKDYTSNSDYTNQITRCYCFFKYLEDDEKFSSFVSKHYREMGIDSYHDIIYKIIILFSAILKNESGRKNPIIKTIDDIELPHNRFLFKLSFDPLEVKYAKDESFTSLRNSMFARTPNKKFLLLDINFMIDCLYKSQVFSFDKFMKTNGIKNFLSVKAEEFMEQSYLDLIMKRCFPNMVCIPGKRLIKADKNPLTDFFVKKSQQALVIEFKDTLFGAAVKNSGDSETIFNALDLKFLKNQVKDPKGIQQVANAINYLSTNPQEFVHISNECREIFPVVIYTDNTFGYDGLNKVYRQKFKLLLNKDNPAPFQIHDVVFINLNFFEIFENHIQNNSFDFFELLIAYNRHVQNENFNTTPFEVFGAMYIRDRVKTDLGIPALYRETCDIVNRHFASINISRV